MIAQSFTDLPYEQALSFIKNMGHHSSAAFASKSTNPGYKYTPGVTWIYTQQDLTVRPDLQQQAIDRINEARGSGREVEVIKKDWGHAPNVSQVDALAEVMVEILKKS
jgi:hypothetical protein